MKGRKITINLVDGSAYGPRVVEIGNWVGMAFFCPRAKIEETLAREQWENPGVYCLRFEEERSGKEMIYWGQAENVKTRIKNHLGNPRMKEFSELVFFTSKDDSLTQTQIRYLEHRLIAIAKEKGVLMHNVAMPARPRIHEADGNDMEFFLEQIQLILPLMGFRFMIEGPGVVNSMQEEGFGRVEEKAVLEEVAFKVVETERVNEPSAVVEAGAGGSEQVVEKRTRAASKPKVSVSVAYKEEAGQEKSLEAGGSEFLKEGEGWSSRLVEVVGETRSVLIKGKYHFVPRTINATMDIEEGRYVVRQGSQASKKNHSSLGNGYLQLKNRLVELGVLRDEGDRYVFTRDCKFSSSSTSSSIILGQSSAGPRHWVDDENRSFRGV